MFVIGRVNNQPFFVFVVEDVLKRRVSEHALPTIVVEVRKIVGGSGNGSEPVIEDDVKLWGNVPRLRIQDERNRTGVFVRESKVDGAS